MKDKSISVNEALMKAKKACSLKETCSFDIREKLFAWGIDKNNSDKIIKELIEHNYIDNERYARFYVRDKYRFNKWGRIKIKYQLILKQIPENIIQIGFEEIDEKLYAEILFDIISKKNKTIKSRNKHELVSKLMQYTSSKGYENDISFNLIQEILK